MNDASANDGTDDLEERMATEFLERLLGDRLEGAYKPLADYLAAYPGFEARIAREWLLAEGHAVESPKRWRAPESDTDARLIGTYRVIREVGRGGQGTVYLAEDTRMGRTVALKVLTRGLAPLDSAALLRLHREAQALARLEHPGVATVFELGETDATAWIAMRYVPGGSLHQAIAARAASGEGPPRTPDELTTILRLYERAARALHAAHVAGILHRDVKPANILLAGPDDPVLVDFGIARDDQGDMPTITLPGAVFGTLGYMSPERLHGAQADARADVYGLGAALFESLTLERPYAAATTAAEMNAIANASLRDVRSLNRAVSKSLALVVATALAKEPTARYQTAAAFADDLERLLTKRPIRAKPPTIVDRLVHFCQRERALASSIGATFAVLLVGLVTVTWLWRENRSSLSSVMRLSDLKLARELRQREDELWPARQSTVRAMQAWLEDAQRLRRRTPEHAALLASLPAAGIDETADWQRDQLDALRTELADFDERIAAVDARVERAVTLEARTLVHPAALWVAARARIAANPTYHGLDIEPQLGLVPLGPDGRSALEEFAHAESGTVPTRDESTGELVLSDASAIILVLMPGGEVVLGAEPTPPPDGHPANVDPEVPREQMPSYVVQLDPYFLGKHELTQAQWLRHTGINPSAYQPSTSLTTVEGLMHPVELVTWVEVDRVLRQLDLRVPTEAQWETAYRAGTHVPYPYGADVKSLIGHENLADVSAQGRTTNRQLRFIEWLDDGNMIHATVGSFAPNAYGFYDMGGNVKEWCDDSWEDYDAVKPRPGDGLRRGSFERYRVVRGGCFASAADEARAASRYGGEKMTRGAEAGVRAARDLTR